MIFNSMFERAAAFSAIAVFILFGIIGHKYLMYMEAKNESAPTADVPLTENQLSRVSTEQ